MKTLINRRIANLIMIIALVILSQCSTPSHQPADLDTDVEKEGESIFTSIAEDDLVIKEIDGCEYIIYLKSPNTNKGFGLMAHKGNCKNLIHVYNKLDSL